MVDPTLLFFAGLVLAFILAALAHWAFAVRRLRADAAAEYAQRVRIKPGTVRNVSEQAFVALYVSCFQPRWTLYASAGAAAALTVSPLALVAIPALYDAIWRANGAPEWGGRTGYVFMFALFFGIVFVWASVAAIFARLHHMRAPEPWTHALARARGEPIPEETGWRRRPKWARRARPDGRSGEAASRDTASNDTPSPDATRRNSGAS